MYNQVMPKKGPDRCPGGIGNPYKDILDGTFMLTSAGSEDRERGCLSSIEVNKEGKVVQTVTHHTKPSCKK